MAGTCVCAERAFTCLKIDVKQYRLFLHFLLLLLFVVVVVVVVVGWRGWVQGICISSPYPYSVVFVCWFFDHLRLAVYL